MKKAIIILFAILSAPSAFSAFLKNVPIELKQPDGVIIHCFVTGDEYHRRVHDKDDYTIIQNSQSGYFVYAIKDREALIPSDHIVGKCDPKQLPIEPNYDIPFQKDTGGKAKKLKSAAIINETPTKGDFNNIVISIRFSGQAPTILSLQDYTDFFNSTSNVSLNTFYKEVSNSQLNIASTFYPKPQNQTILEYQDSHPREYFTPYNIVTNPIGYQAGESLNRELTLVHNALSSVNDQITGSPNNYDLNNDGFIDNVIFIMQGNGDRWGDVLWPSTMTLDGIQMPLGNKQVNRYNKQFSLMLNSGIICHEFFHSLGAPDLYHYNTNGLDPDGGWDIMASSLPEHMTTYLKWKYGKWFDALPVINQPGTYTLQPVSQSPYACYKIPSPDNPNEYFIVEYRKKEGSLESAIPGNYDDGLIICRINTLVPWGNADGPPDEIYIYRPDGTISINGDISKASLSSNSGRSSLNSNTNPSCFLSNGDRGWLDISNVSSSGTQISFTLNAVTPLYKPLNLNASVQRNQIALKWNNPVKKSIGLLGYNIYLDSSSSPVNGSIVTDTTFTTLIPGQNMAYSFKVKAKYSQGESDPATCSFVNPENPTNKDSLALVALYNQCGGPNWTRKSNWLTGPLNSWQGVTVENGRVVALLLGTEDRYDTSVLGVSVGLIGIIPSEISNLTEIKVLDLSNNQLTGPIPDSWLALVNLQEIFLKYNQLSGSLPQSWSILVNLNWLVLEHNQFTGVLPTNWHSLVNLLVLDLSYNQISGTLPESWYTLVRLQNLWLNNNKLNGSLPINWTNFPELTQLIIGNNQLTGPLPESWSALINLKKLDLPGNQLSGNLPINWSSLVNLTELQLVNNQLTGPLPESWSALVKLQYLYLSGTSGSNGNQFTGSLPDKWSSLISLIDLNLSDNKLSGTLPESWSALVNIRDLILFNNQLEGNLPNGWSTLINLRTLYLENNHLTGSLPKSWSSLVNLNYLTLRYNQLTGNLPESWLALVNLQYLFLDNNQIIGLPNLSSLTNLTNFDIENNILDFGSIEPNISVSQGSFNYSPQAPIGKADTLIKKQSEEVRISVSVAGKYNIYHWFKDGNSIIGANGTEYIIPTFTISDVGIYTCHITNTVATQLTLTSQPITLQILNQPPVANAGIDQNVIEGANVTLDGSASTCDQWKTLTYKWAAPSGISLSSTTVSKPTFTAPIVTQATTLTFNLIVNDGTSDSPADLVIIIVNPLPSNAGQISGVTTICQNQSSVIYNVSPIANATSYIWTLPRGAAGTSSTNSIIVDYGASAISGNIKVKGHNDFGDGAESSLAITVNPKPVTPIVTETGQILHSNAATGNQWYNNNVLINGATSQDYMFTAIGKYSVIVSQNGCASDSSITNVITGSEQMDFSKKIIVYPNPVSDDLTIEYSGNFEEVKFKIVNLAGQTLFDGKLLDKTIVHTSSFAAGLYFIKFDVGKTVEFKKVIKN